MVAYLDAIERYLNEGISDLDSNERLWDDTLYMTVGYVTAKERGRLNFE